MNYYYLNTVTIREGSLRTVSTYAVCSATPLQTYSIRDSFGSDTLYGKKLNRRTKESLNAAPFVDSFGTKVRQILLTRQVYLLYDYIYCIYNAGTTVYNAVTSTCPLAPFFHIDDKGNGESLTPTVFDEETHRRLERQYPTTRFFHTVRCLQMAVEGCNYVNCQG